MIPKNHIIEWKKNANWSLDSQVEQDLIISRAIVEIFNNKILSEKLAFRGGTALHKLFLTPQSRYSEDIDLVQIKSEPIKPIYNELEKVLKFIGMPQTKTSKDNNTAFYRFESEIPPVVKLKLKIEINCREHFTELGFSKVPFEINTKWYKGKCEIITYQIEELLGTKIRALYQRSKGRDLYDLYKAIISTDVNVESVIECYKTYMEKGGYKIPTRKVYIANTDKKMKDKEFLNDINALLKPGEKYDNDIAYQLIKEAILEKL
jgi:predicted nucleotidyltransferase component of viral defense system